MTTASFLSEEVRRLLTAPQVAQHYGFEPNRAGFIPCPFHHEKTASLKLYPEDRGWHCFGCHTGGSVIDFVMALFGISFSQAILRINADFRLGLSLEAPDKEALSERVQEQQRKAAETARFRREYDEKTREYQQLFLENQIEHADRLLYLDYWFEEHPWR